MLFSVVFILSHFLAIATGFFVFVNIKQNPPCCSPDICKIVIQDQITGIERDSTQFRAHQLFTNKKRKLQFNRVSHFRYERRRRDSNPRAPEGKRISSAPRYDHFDTSPEYSAVALLIIRLPQLLYYIRLFLKKKDQTYFFAVCTAYTSWYLIPFQIGRTR